MSTTRERDTPPVPSTQVSAALSHDSVGNRVVTLGPDDPDNLDGVTTRLGVHNKAKALLIRHARNHPEPLMRALSAPEDEARTSFLRSSPQLIVAAVKVANEVRGKRRWLFGDDVVEGISVIGGLQGTPLMLSFIFRKGGSGRSARGVLGYDRVPVIEVAYQEKLQEATVPARALQDPSGQDEEVAARADEAEAALRDAQAEHAAELAKLREDFEEMQGKVEELENPEPYEGYAEMNATDVIADLKVKGAGYFGQLGLDRIRDYETETKNRTTVLGALDDLETELPAAPDASGSEG